MRTHTLRLGDLFEREQRLLDETADIHHHEEGNWEELRTQAAKLHQAYAKLLGESRKLLVISDSQGDALKQRESDIRRLLEQTSQGFLKFSPSRTVLKPYSTECERIFQCKPYLSDITELLWSEQPEQLHLAQHVIASAFEAEEEAAGDALLQQLPKHVALHGRTIRIRFKRIADDAGHEQSILLTMTDETDRLRDEAKVEYLSSIDPLTGLSNRTYLEREMTKWIQAQRFPICVLVFDLNGLKLTNDVFGHEAGDRLLIRTGKLLRTGGGPMAVCARWGGDEFIVAIPETNADGGHAVLERIRSISAQEQPDPIRVHVAAGFACMEEGDGDWKPVMQAAERGMYRMKLLEGHKVRSELAHEVGAVLRSRALESDEHVAQIKHMVRTFVRRLDIAPHSLEERTLLVLADLHDVGNIAIPASIFRKTEPLTDDEWETLQSHSETGYRLAMSLGESAAAQAILGLHERWDGTGYPYGLQGEQIPLLSRIYAVLDAYHAMLSDRPYRKAFSRVKALDEIRRNEGTQFDPSVVRAFVAHIRDINP